MVKNDPWRFDSPGVRHPRRTVGLDLPGQVARQQSLTPLLQAGEESRVPGRHQASSSQRHHPEDAELSEAPHGSPRTDASVPVGKDAPEELNQGRGRPRRKYVDFLLLIGAIHLSLP
jgi:hypothetical protein